MTLAFCKQRSLDKPIFFPRWTSISSTSPGDEFLGKAGITVFDDVLLMHRYIPDV